jgi:hypothetical protein
MKQQWDWHHVSLILAYTFGVVYGGWPIAYALIAGGPLNATKVAIGLGTLTVAAVGGFLKLPPGATLPEATQDGENAVKS